MKVPRLLAIRPGAIGDCILSFPALESLRLRTDFLEIWVPTPVVPLVKFAHKVRAISNTGLDLVGLPGLDAPPKMLANYDAIVSWYGTNRDDFRTATSHLPIKFHRALPDSTNLHAVDFFCAQLQTPPLNPRIQIDAPKRDFIAIHPFSGSPKKNWPHFHDAAKQLPNVQWCATAQNPHAISHDLGQVSHWLAEARLYIGNDSGITHLAAAVGTPVIAIFQASDPRIWAPRGDHVTILQSPTIEQVLKAIL